MFPKIYVAGIIAESLTESEEEEQYDASDRGAVIRRVMTRSGPGIVLAAVAAAFSYFPFILTGFRGLVELGIITGVGTLLLLFSDFTILPTLSLLIPGGKKPKPSYTGLYSTERNLLSFSPCQACLILVGVAILCVLSASAVGKVHFDLNPLRLQDPSAESVQWEKILVENSERSVLSCAAFAQSLEEMETKAQSFKALASVSQVETVFSFLPEHQEEKMALLRTIIPFMPELHPYRGEIGPQDLKKHIDILERIRFKLQEDQAKRWGASRPVVEQMAQVRSLAKEIIEALRVSPTAAKHLQAYQDRFVADLERTWSFFREGLTPTLMTIDDLPPFLTDRFLQEGLYLMRIYPKEHIWEEGALTRFVTQLQSVDSNVVGDPVSLFVFASAFKDACIRASIYALVAIFFLLMLNFRNLWIALLALVPLGVGTLWTVGIMGMLGIQFNLANSIFMPLIVGAGVEYGVVILHRWREGSVKPGHLPYSTGKGVILAALTTTVGFGALMICHHQGIFSLGLVATIGSLCVLVAAIVILPAVLAGASQPESSRPATVRSND